MANKCAICGKKFGFFEGKISLADGMMCTDCWQIGGLGQGAQAMVMAMHKTVAEMKTIRTKIEEEPSVKSSIEVTAQKFRKANGLSWEEFYDHFLKWSPKERKLQFDRLKYFGSAEEVFQICIYVSADSKFMNQFVEKAFCTGVRFAPQQVMALFPLIKQPLRNQIAEFASDKYTKKQLERLYGMIEDGVFYRILSNHGVKFTKPVTEELIEDKVGASDGDDGEPEFWETFFSTPPETEIAARKKKHDGHCDGDCENCPPHYGYRYGRWYYGHNHIEGCEFGGNRGGITWDIQKKRLEK